MINKIKKLIVFVVFTGMFFCSGCGILGIVGTPNQYENTIPAEYDLAGQKGKKVLVLVEKPRWLSAQVNLRYYLTDAICKDLTAKVKVSPKYILSYDKLSEFRSNNNNFSLLSPTEVGKALGADLVLLATIEGYRLSELAETDYYNGALSVRAAIFETATEEKVWPADAEGKSIKVGFETGENGQEAAVKRLVNACAYCISRYFYNCSKYKFELFDEQKEVGWEDL